MKKKIKSDKSRKKDIDLSIRENHEIITIKDFWKVHQILREDYYLLDGLNTFLENLIILGKHNNEELIYDIENIKEKNANFLNESKYMLNDYHRLDEYICSLSVIEGEELFTIMIDNIFLSEKIENLIYRILNYTLKLTSRNNEILSTYEKETKVEFVFRKNIDFSKYLLDSNIENDKIINYELMCDDSKVISKIKDKYNLKNTKESILLKKQDYRYINNVLKERLICENNEIGNIFIKNLEREKIRQMKLLNKILFYIAIITFFFQILNMPENYKNFCNALISYISKNQIDMLLGVIFIILIVILVISEFTIFKDKK